ncbi:hypothetical protein K2D_01890 [Planctomycetes bacterium K2D]|uniref:Uncharacterized protein n=1 Tax=Botrimarina mediterranea TaxID=2528022 RepID=A0A518K2S4_9BACT|nr:hypothetical protein Spa11_02390 [Botrimarina mediterranea]QDV76610.1 hypothetical protein K2D_01890 [Planctomycetes bacterium K2D]
MIPVIASYGGVIECSVLTFLVAVGCYLAARNAKLAVWVRIWAAMGVVLWSLASLWIVCMVRYEIQWYRPIPEWLWRIARAYTVSGVIRILMIAIPIWAIAGIPFSLAARKRHQSNHQVTGEHGD